MADEDGHAAVVAGDVPADRDHDHDHGHDHGHDTDDASGEDVCRICRMEGSHEQPLFNPCNCSGSIRFIHQDWYVPPSSCTRCDPMLGFGRWHSKGLG